MYGTPPVPACIGCMGHVTSVADSSTCTLGQSEALLQMCSHKATIISQIRHRTLPQLVEGCPIQEYAITKMRQGA